VVLVSHDPRNVREFCDRAVLIDSGRILAEGRPAEVADRYVTTLTETTV